MLCFFASCFFAFITLSPLPVENNIVVAQEFPNTTESIDIVIFIEQTDRLKRYFDIHGNARATAIENLIAYLSQLYESFIDPATNSQINIRIAALNFNSTTSIIQNDASIDGDVVWFDLSSYRDRPQELSNNLQNWNNNIKHCFQDLNCEGDYSDFYQAEESIFQLLNSDPNRHLVFLYLSEGWTCRSQSDCDLYNRVSHINRMTELRNLRNQYQHTYEDLSVYLLGMGTPMSATRTTLTTSGDFVVRYLDEDTTSPNPSLMSSHLFPTGLGMLVNAIEGPLQPYGITHYSINNNGLVDGDGKTFELPVPSLQQDIFIASAYPDFQSTQNLDFYTQPNCLVQPVNPNEDVLLSPLAHVERITNPCGGVWSITPADTLQPTNLMNNDGVFVSMQPTTWSAYVIPKVLLQSNQSPAAVINTLQAPFQDFYQYEEALLVIRVSPPNAYITNGTHRFSAEMCATLPEVRQCEMYELTDLAGSFFSTPLGEYWSAEVPIHFAAQHTLSFLIDNTISPVQPIEYNFNSVLVAASDQALQCSQTEGGNPSLGRPGTQWTARLNMQPSNLLTRNFPSNLPPSFIWNATTMIPGIGVPNPIPFNQNGPDALQFEASGHLPNEQQMLLDVVPSFHGDPIPSLAFRCTFVINLVDIAIPEEVIDVVQGQPLAIRFQFLSDDARWLNTIPDARLEVSVRYTDNAQVEQVWNDTIPLIGRLNEYGGQEFGYYDLDLTTLNIPSDVITINYKLVRSPDQMTTILLFPLDDANGVRSSQVRLRR